MATHRMEFIYQLMSAQNRRLSLVKQMANGRGDPYLFSSLQSQLRQIEAEIDQLKGMLDHLPREFGQDVDELRASLVAELDSTVRAAQALEGNKRRMADNDAERRYNEVLDSQIHDYTLQASHIETVLRLL